MRPVVVDRLSDQLRLARVRRQILIEAIAAARREMPDSERYREMTAMDDELDAMNAFIEDWEKV